MITDSVVYAYKDFQHLDRDAPAAAAAFGLPFPATGDRGVVFLLSARRRVGTTPEHPSSTENGPW